MGLDGERIQTRADRVIGGKGEEEAVEVGGGREVWTGGSSRSSVGDESARGGEQ